MKMIIRTLCAAALVFGAASLTGCGDKAADKTDTSKVQKTDATAKGAADAAKGAADAAKGAADAAKGAVDKK